MGNIYNQLDDSLVKNTTIRGKGNKLRAAGNQSNHSLNEGIRSW